MLSVKQSVVSGHRQVTVAAQSWNSEGRDAGALYRGARLVTAQVWAEQPDRRADLSPLEADFLDASVRQLDGERHRRKRVTVIAVAVATLVLVGATITGAVIRELDTPRGPAAVTAEPVTADMETDPVTPPDGETDAAAIWRYDADPSRSVIIGAGSDGLTVYDLTGQRTQLISGPAMNNVDLRGDLVGAIDSQGTLMHFYLVTLTGAGARLAPIGQLTPNFGTSGFCLYRSRLTGHTYAFVITESGGVEQWQVDVADGKIEGKAVRGPWVVGNETEGCVADDAHGMLYVAEEARGIWRYAAEPDRSPAERITIDTIDGGRLVKDIEGLALVHGYLIASSQGDGTFVVYRTNDLSYVRKIRIVAGRDVDGCDSTEGIAAAPGPFGAQFPDGVFVCQDEHNPETANTRENYKYIRLEKIIGQ